MTRFLGLFILFVAACNSSSSPNRDAGGTGQGGALAVDAVAIVQADTALATGGVTRTGGMTVVATGGVLRTGGSIVVATGGLVLVATGGTPPVDAAPATGGSKDAGGDTGGGVAKDAGGDTGVAPTVDTGSVAETGAAPTFSLDFTTADKSRVYSRADNGGSATLGITNASATDNAVAELIFKGNAALGPNDKLTPDFATEVGTNQTFGYGTFRTRVQLAKCAATEELVNGVFTFFNDGKDHDGDGLIDNSEIDIEILCSDPSIISLTIWSEYSSDTAKQGVSRVIHTKTGAYEDSLNDTTPLGSGTLAAFKLPGFPDPNAFYEMGFEWHATSLRYFIVVGGAEITLWTYTNPKYIPSLPAAFLFNVWHSTDWWDSKGTADYPAADAVMRVDWFKYWKE